jgi:uncharacterized Zn-binding protein involved in type VI secretion
MPSAYRKGDYSVGADGGAPTELTAFNHCIKTYINSKLAAVIGDQHQPHVVPPIHSGSQRAISSGANKTFWEGVLAARTGDSIADGDICGEGSPNTFIE